jgi:transcriptional regulator with XRE-family HTH domain
MRCSLHRTEIGLLERGARVPRIDTVIKIATGLGVDADLLLAGIEWTPGTNRPGAFKIASRIAKHRALMERAAKLREGQTGTSDVAALIREARDELEQRAERWKEDEEEEG